MLEQTQQLWGADKTQRMTETEEDKTRVKMAGKSHAAVDDVLLALNWFGPYQRLQFFILTIHVIPVAMNNFAIIFIGRNAEHRCAPSEYTSRERDAQYETSPLGLFATADEDYLNTSTTTFGTFNITETRNTTIDYGGCSIKFYNTSGELISRSGCDYGYAYKMPREGTIVSEWDLVCDREALSDLSQMLLSVGQVVGGTVFSYLSDRYGRKFAYMLGHGIFFILAMATTFAPNFAVFATLRFFIGASGHGFALAAVVLMTEQLPTQHRALTAQVGIFAQTLGMLILGLLAYLTRDLSWRYTQLLLVPASLHVLIQWWITDESLRWLVANQKIEKTQRVILKAAKRNKVDVKSVIDILREQTTDCDETFMELSALAPSDDISHNSRSDVENTLDADLKVDAVVQDNQSKLGPLDALKNRRVIMVVAICSFMWFADTITYYGIVMTSANLVDDLYVGYTVNILVEIPAGIAFALYINRIGRKKCLWISNIITGVGLALAMLLSVTPAAKAIPGVGIIAVVLSLIGKFGVSLAYHVLWLYTPELFPTNIRNFCFGISSTIGRVGGMVSPYSRTLARHIPWAPGLVFSVLCLLTSAMTWFLPETQGKELPQTIAEMEDQARIKKSNSADRVNL